MPWYKLPRTNLAMWFDQKMPNLNPARKPRVKPVKPEPQPDQIPPEEVPVEEAAPGNPDD